MKRFFLILTLFFVSSVPTFAGSFSDVPEAHENYAAIEYLFGKGVVSGYESGGFGPENSVKRAEAAKIITKAFNIATDGEYEILFPDVLSEQWFFPYVMGSQSSGVINGHSDGYFRPGDNVNLAETLKMVVLASAVELPSEVNEEVFADISSGEWFSPHAYYAREKNILWPDNYGLVHPAEDMTRGEFAEIIYRMSVVLENDGKVFPIDTNWSGYESSVVPFSIRYDSENWKISEGDGQVILLRPDVQYHQSTPGKIYDNTGEITVSLDDNDSGLSKSQYFNNIITAFPGLDYKEFMLDGYNALEVIDVSKNVVDWYVYVDGGKVLIVYTEYGDGTLSYQLQKLIKTMLANFQYTQTVNTDYSQLLSDIFSIILVEGKGMEYLNKLPNKIIVETDALGVGTGPVDYYYSEGVDYTFKYERSSDVILDKRAGNTTAF